MTTFDLGTTQAGTKITGGYMPMEDSTQRELVVHLEKGDSMDTFKFSEVHALCSVLTDDLDLKLEHLEFRLKLDVLKTLADFS